MKVTDPSGVRWSVRRKWVFGLDGGSQAFSSIDHPIGLLVVPIALVLLWAALWPFWWAAHWLGLKWVIRVKREGTAVGEVEVRGWGESRRHMQEIVQSLASRGTTR